MLNVNGSGVTGAVSVGVTTGFAFAVFGVGLGSG
jgi:hypothetical protein